METLTNWLNSLNALTIAVLLVLGVCAGLTLALALLDYLSSIETRKHVGDFNNLKRKQNARQ